MTGGQSKEEWRNISIEQNLLGIILESYSMKSLLLRCVLLFAFVLPGAFAAETDSANAGWKQIFDGKTLEGWVQHGGKAKYTIEDGVIIGSCVPNTPNSFLCTARDYTNFVLELEINVDNGLNSGVQFRSQVFDKPTHFEWKGRTVKVPAGRVHGLQAEVDTSARAWSAGVYEEGARGWLYDLKNNEAARKAFKKEDWNKYHIECRGDSIKTWINDIPAAGLKDSRVPAGFIALQVHGIGKNEKELSVRFRNIRIKEL